ncbi:pirin family protein [Alteromonas aestuariivivens]|uniref:Pirin family protein n=1 Tax=Alteromonas aestuariivivens TaxID=1938339 RepID=A0A3D8M2S8_9ALTE|nr:pirin family protein [Alteromonas aestuariivivens]RDV23928.1 pirin family protein [Alteromonas aestuariivivens]
MIYIRRANERGKVNLGWLNSRHSFSFGHYYDPKHMGVSVLRVINDDVVEPGRGFDTHGHRDMEIVSYVVEGALEHKDSKGNQYVIPAGDVQRMSAGKGILHSEYNASATKPVNFMQIWITPNVTGIEPSYEQKTIEQSSALTPIVSPDGQGNSVRIHQDASIFRLQLEPGQQHTLSTQGRIGYLHLVKGEAETDTHSFASGDAFALGPSDSVTVSAASELEALWFDLPQTA